MMVVKVEKKKQDNIVLVVVLAMPDNRQQKEELAELMKEALKKTKFPTVYGIVGYITSFLYKLEKSGPPEPQLVFGPTGASYPSFLEYMTELTATINEMTTRSIQEQN
ncbi:hypothetical protein Clacol_005199, partial [Clathrus columnatus]